MKSKQLEAGQKFGRLTVIKLDHIKEYITPEIEKYNQEYYLCKCECEKECIILKQSLMYGNTKSCGCLQKEKITKHSLKNTKLYNIWQNIKARCYNENRKNYKDYGSRGIIICDEWKNDFKSFYDWAMANGYIENEGRNILTIDRINNDGNYEPSNCRFIDNKQQQRNKRNNRLITYNGETHCIKEWSEKLGINYNTLKNRTYNRQLIVPIGKFTRL